jgi:hypothetical protein
MRCAVLTGLCGALTAFALLVLASAGPAAVSPGELLADPDRFDGQAVTLQGTVEKVREGVSPDGAPYYKFQYILWLTVLSASGAEAPVPLCTPVPGREAEQLQGEVIRGQGFGQSTRGGWILRLVPVREGWLLEVAMKGRQHEDLSHLTPPWHFVPNPREIEGWHFRNADNTGANDGSVNAPQELREFIFSPEVGRGIEYHGSGTTSADVAQVEAFGRGWLHLDAFRLTPPRRGERASFEWLKFSACLTWPANIRTEPTR